MPDLVDFARSKRVAETFRDGMDFAGVMEAGDTINTVQVTAQDSLGTSVTGDLIQGGTGSGTVAAWTYKAWGTIGQRYYVRVAVVTAGGDTRIRVVGLSIEGQ